MSEDRQPSPPQTEALLENAAFLEAIIENIPNMIFVKDAEELRFVRFNKAGEQLLGIPRAQMYGKNDHDFFPADEADFFTAKDRSVLASGALHDIAEEPIHTISNGVRWLHTRKIPIADSSGRPLYLLGISEDITEHRELTVERERLMADLGRSNRDLEQFAFAASHDLQAPLRKVQAFGDLLKAKFGEALGAEGGDYLDRMCASAARMELLIQDLLEFSRVATRTRPLTRVSLTSIAQAALENLSARIEESAGVVEIGELPAIDGDRAQLERMLQNLISNGLKFHKPGVPPRVTVSAELIPEAASMDTSGPVDMRCELSVRDEGIGLDPAHAERVFGVFQRLHGRDDYPGTGIGLALCRKIAERHRGSIRVESKEGAGATFVVRLPQNQPDP